MVVKSFRKTLKTIGTCTKCTEKNFKTLKRYSPRDTVPLRNSDGRIREKCTVCILIVKNFQVYFSLEIMKPRVCGPSVLQD
jgi:hypothetical protein